MAKLALLVRLVAKPGKENEVRDFLKSGLEIVEAEPAPYRGLPFNLAQALLASSIHFLMEKEGKHIFPGKLRQR